MGQNQMTIDEESPATADIVALLSVHLEFSSATSPHEHVHALDLERLLDPSVTFCAARNDRSDLLGIGALRDLGNDRAEVKSMHTTIAARGRGVGRAMITHLVDLAWANGVTWIGLETGTMEEFAPARALYRSVGFQPCEPFDDYTVNPYSCYMSLLAQFAGR